MTRTDTWRRRAVETPDGAALLLVIIQVAIDSAGRIVIPKPVRDRLELGRGEVVEIRLPAVPQAGRTGARNADGPSRGHRAAD